MTTLGIVLLVAVLFAVAALLTVAVVATLGLETDQVRLKMSLRSAGAAVCLFAAISENWLYVLLGAGCLVLSLPRVNLPRFSQRLDKSLAPPDRTTHPLP
jgi:hypothetical protein